MCGKRAIAQSTRWTWSETFPIQVFHSMPDLHVASEAKFQDVLSVPSMADGSTEVEAEGHGKCRRVANTQFDGLKIGLIRQACDGVMNLDVQEMPSTNLCYLTIELRNEVQEAPIFNGPKGNYGNTPSWSANALALRFLYGQIGQMEAPLDSQRFTRAPQKVQ
ncbi:hypothetical protein EDB19DRAFT_1832404 [Suillus lakei]|nr:hypothetical protein EDB19DRAFT_1832404 [Suillus lakei]